MGLNHWFWRCLRLKMLKQARYMKKSMNIELQLACPYRAGLGRVAPSRTSMWQKALHLLHQLPSWQLQPTVTQLDGFMTGLKWNLLHIDRGGITISSGVSWSSGGELQQRHQCMQQERSMAVGTATLGDSQRCRCGCLCVHPDCLSGLGRKGRRFLHILVASHDADDSTEMTWNDIMTSCWSCDSCVDIRIGRSLAPGCGFVCSGFVCCGFVCCGCGWCVVRRRLRQLGSGSRRSLSSRRWRDQRLCASRRRWRPVRRAPWHRWGQRWTDCTTKSHVLRRYIMCIVTLCYFMLMIASVWSKTLTRRLDGSGLNMAKLCQTYIYTSLHGPKQTLFRRGE